MRRSSALILALSGGAFAGLLALLYARTPPSEAPAWSRSLPAANAACNAASAACVLAGLSAIASGRRRLHRGLMLSALAFSALFLAGYITYHRLHGDTHYPGLGWMKGLYFFVLISHILLSALVLPLVLASVWAAASGAFERHKRLTRWAAPLWLYVSVTGVLVYAFLRPYY